MAENYSQGRQVAAVAHLHPIQAQYRLSPSPPPRSPTSFHMARAWLAYADGCLKRCPPNVAQEDLKKASPTCVCVYYWGGRGKIRDQLPPPPRLQPARSHLPPLHPPQGGGESQGSNSCSQLSFTSICQLGIPCRTRLTATALKDPPLPQAGSKPCQRPQDLGEEPRTPARHADGPAAIPRITNSRFSCDVM